MVQICLGVSRCTRRISVDPLKTEVFSTTAGLELDLWLSEMLGKNAYRLTVDANFPLMLSEPCFVYAKIPAAKTQEIARLEQNGFSRVEISVLYEKKISNNVANTVAATSFQFRFAVPMDEEETAALSARSMEYSRFHRDPKIGKKIADRLKGEWARNYFKGTRGNQMVVATNTSNEIIGFLQLVKKSKTLIIDLVGVDERVRGKGVARGMVQYAIAENPGFENIQAGTQSNNPASTQFYQKMGFVPVASTAILHAHFGDKS